jgi:hypothetical protein
MRDTLSESQKQTGIAQQQLESTTRAWMSAEVTINGPLTFEKDGMHIKCVVKSHNFGPSPALFTRIIPDFWSDQVLSYTNFDMGPNNENPNEKRMCPDNIVIPMGATIFPQRDLINAFDLRIPNGSIKSPSTMPGYLAPIIVGCVEYAVTTPSSKVKKTLFSYTVFRQGIPIILGTDVPVEQLGLMRNPTSAY